MAKKHKHEEHENHERWLVSYADFITLLFAFFVVMYSVSSVNEGKFRTVSESIQAALRPMVSQPAAAVHFDIGEFKSSLVPTLGQKVQFVRQIQEVMTRFNKATLHDTATVVQTAHGVMISIADSMVFESGKADLRSDALPVLQGLAEVLIEHAYNVKEVKVQGHTDNVPIRSALFPSNWELSAVRAVMVARVLTELYQVRPELISATGFAEFRPLTQNLTPEDRAKNRRVELLVIMNDDQQPAL
jgi:chemotaxis protein MotB